MLSSVHAIDIIELSLSFYEVYEVSARDVALLKEIFDDDAIVKGR